MAHATVFVDDAVLVRLPPICVKEGVPTPGRLTVVTRVVGSAAGLGVAWLLLRAGPLGWIGLILIAVMRRPSEMLTVQLPITEAACDGLRRAKRELWPCALAVPVLLILALFVLGHDHRLLAGAIGVLVVLAAGWWVSALVRMRAFSVSVELDASRRWVTLGRVHPTFAQSCADGQRQPVLHRDRCAG